VRAAVAIPPGRFEYAEWKRNRAGLDASIERQSTNIREMYTGSGRDCRLLSLFDRSNYSRAAAQPFANTGRNANCTPPPGGQKV